MFIGFYNYTVVLTYAGLVSAVTGMAMAMGGHFRAALICLIISGLCDMFDGIVARTNKKRCTDAKRFGVQIDSLCDVICFSVFPAVLGMCLYPANVLSVACGAIFVLAGVIRLAYYNVQEQSREENDEGKRKYFSGVPVTISALIMPAAALICTIGNLGRYYFYPIILLVLGILNISRVKIKKPYKIGIVIMSILGTALFVLVLLYGGNVRVFVPAKA